MRKHFAIVTSLGVAAVVGLALAVSPVRSDEVKSGLALGDAPGAFNVQDCTGPAAGTSLCYRCRYSSSPVVAVFTRKLDDNVTSLLKKVDAEVAKNKEKGMKAFVVYLTDDPDAAEPKLKELAKKNDIKNVPLTIFDGPAGPPSYKLAKNADVTILMWVKSDVKVNHAFGEGKLDKDAIGAIVKDSAKILN